MAQRGMHLREILAELEALTSNLNGTEPREEIAQRMMQIWQPLADSVCANMGIGTDSPARERAITAARSIGLALHSHGLLPAPLVPLVVGRTD